MSIDPMRRDFQYYTRTIDGQQEYLSNSKKTNCNQRNDQTDLVLDQIDDQILQLSRQFKLVAKAYHTKDELVFGDLWKEYKKNLDLYLSFVEDSLYKPLETSLSTDTERRELDQFKLEAKQFLISLYQCIDKVDGVDSRVDSKFQKGIYSIDNRLFDWHIKERQFLYPLYEKKT